MATYAHTPNQSLIAPGTSLAASATNTATLDLSTALEALVQVVVSAGAAVQAANGITVGVYPQVDGATASYAALFTVSSGPIGASVTTGVVFSVNGGHKYTIKTTNLDTANAVTLNAFYDVVTGIS